MAVSTKKSSVEDKTRATYLGRYLAYLVDITYLADSKTI